MKTANKTVATTFSLLILVLAIGLLAPRGGSKWNIFDGFRGEKITFVATWESAVRGTVYYSVGAKMYVLTEVPGVHWSTVRFVPPGTAVSMQVSNWRHDTHESCVIKHGEAPVSVSSRDDMGSVRCEYVVPA